MVYIARIDSRDRTTDSKSNTDFISNTLPLHTISVRIKQIVIPNLFPNIRASPTTDANSTFSYETGGAPATVVVPTGYYSTTELLAYLTAQLTAITITFAQNTNTGLITITNGGAATFDVINSADGNAMASALGITTSATLAPAATQTFGNRPNIYNHSLIYVQSSKLANSFNCISGTKRLPIVATIPVDVAFGANIIYEPNELHDIVFESSYNIEDIDIKIVNHYGEVLELPSNHSVQVLIECDRVDNVA